MAFVWQCFFEENTKNEKMQIELQCYVLRKLIGADVDALMGVKSGEKNTDFYACSLSSKTIVYKGQLMPEQVRVSASRLSKTPSPTPSVLFSTRGPLTPRFRVGGCGTASNTVGQFDTVPFARKEQFQTFSACVRYHRVATFGILDSPSFSSR